MYCWSEPANGCSICIGSGLWEVRTPKVHSAAGELFWLCRPGGVLPLTSIYYAETASAGWDYCGIGAIPLTFRTLHSAGASRSPPGRRELIWGKRITTRGNIATRYSITKEYSRSLKAWIELVRCAIEATENFEVLKGIAQCEDARLACKSAWLALREHRRSHGL